MLWVIAKNQVTINPKGGKMPSYIPSGNTGKHKYTKALIDAGWDPREGVIVAVEMGTIWRPIDSTATVCW